MNSDDLMQQWQSAWPREQWQHERILLAISGGADSVAMLRLILASPVKPGQLVVGHFDHQLRSDSVDDANFVRELAAQHQLKFSQGTANVRQKAAQQGDGIEAAARQARYAWLQETAEQHNARYVLTAHTADDQVETILHRILRGTSLTGLAGIPRVRKLGPAISLVRPLLTIRRDQLRNYLGQHGQGWREDPSNQSLDITRNRLRHELLPLLTKEFHPAVDLALLRLGKMASQVNLALAPVIDYWCQQLISPLLSEPGCLIRQTDNTDCTDFILGEVLKRAWQQQGWPLGPMTAEHYSQLVSLLRVNDASIITVSQRPEEFTHRTDYPGNVRVTKTAVGIELRSK